MTNELDAIQKAFDLQVKCEKVVIKALAQRIPNPQTEEEKTIVFAAMSLLDVNDILREAFSMLLSIVASPADVVH
jgi:hypothetical protein